MVLSTREKRVISELSMDSRASQADVARRMRVSPQNLKYHIDSLRERGVFSESVILDPAKFGLITIRVFLSYTTFSERARGVVVDALVSQEEVVFVQKLRLGADLLVEYTVPNLSLFNKLHTSFLDKFSNFVKNKHIFPVLVRYEFERTYLHSSAKSSSAILSGDREVADIGENDFRVLAALVSDPSSSVASLARDAGLDPRTVRRCLRDCLDERVIRGFSVTLDYELSDIKSAILGIEFSHVTPQEMKRFVSFAREVDEVVGLTKVIGRENVFVRIETFENFTEVIERLRSEFSITDYQVYVGGNVVKNNHIPFSVLNPQQKE
ncbi:MAG: winged helix-turn-helix transcriptional regulator [Candidatus Woesearchaeota archaeon]